MKLFRNKIGDFYRKQKGNIKIFAFLFLSIFVLELVAVMQLPYINSLGSLIDMVLPETIVSLTNQNREDIGIEILDKNDLLNLAAQLKAADMAENGYFSHTSPDGITPWYWFNLVGYNYAYAGENLAVNFTDSYDIDKAWMESPKHKKNIINEKFDEIGVGTAVGEYKGKEALFVVQLFGTLNKEQEEEVAIVNEQEDQNEVSGDVLGVEDPIDEEEESFMYTDNKEEFIYEDIAYDSFFSKLISNPINIYLIAILLILIIPVLVKIIFRLKIKFLNLLMYGIVLFIVVILTLLFNNYIFT
ncbi:MAG: CAP domain-containing protein [Bacilli bacterium]|nr:CAP domain-containing protein [Bacilli bacterium]